ncbi:unnamed protein product [Blepharisma stoltei]|uniref:Uncharacterized protein n=1 Tax=Blepharisma stoltei TaxID=1481888 RepID=A0AAU9IV61_9CILI|nr:unnamed protein product [Blepharisma stoltei]
MRFTRLFILSKLKKFWEKCAILMTSSLSAPIWYDFVENMSWFAIQYKLLSKIIAIYINQFFVIIINDNSIILNLKQRVQKFYLAS